MKYTYDTYHWYEDLHGVTSGKGATNLKQIHSLFKKLKKAYPLRVHLLIRRPDNVVIDFHHPYQNNIF